MPRVQNQCQCQCNFSTVEMHFFGSAYTHFPVSKAAPYMMQRIPMYFFCSQTYTPCCFVPLCLSLTMKRQQNIRPTNQQQKSQKKEKYSGIGWWWTLNNQWARKHPSGFASWAAQGVRSLGCWGLQACLLSLSSLVSTTPTTNTQKKQRTACRSMCMCFYHIIWINSAIA